VRATSWCFFGLPAGFLQKQHVVSAVRFFQNAFGPSTFLPH
jgi:hypothetical protein